MNGKFLALDLGFLKTWQWLWSQELPVALPVSLGLIQTTPHHHTQTGSPRSNSGLLTLEELPVVDNQDSGLVQKKIKTSDMQSASCEQVCVWQGKQLVNVNGCLDMPKCLLWMIASGRQAWMGLLHILWVLRFKAMIPVQFSLLISFDYYVPAN